LFLNRRIQKQIQYFLMRHPVPLSAQDFHSLRNGPLIFSNSLPKAGTHLLQRLLSLLPNTSSTWSYHFDEAINGFGNYQQLATARSGQVVTAHIPHSIEIMSVLDAHDFIKFFMLRDPRDAVISGAHYITNMDRTHRLSPYYNSLATDDERIMATIRGVEGPLIEDGIRSKSIGEHLESFLEWISEPSCLIVKFEDLVGSAGGGNDHAQHESIKLITEHLGMSLSAAEIKAIAAQVFSTKSKTFRKGQIGTWKDRLTAEHKIAFKAVAGEALILMGYEKDLNW
jgi:hypothetical protein